jgi:hypothetical protein
VLDKSADVPAQFILSVSYKRQERHYGADIRWRRRDGLGVKLRPLPATDSRGLLGLAVAPTYEDEVINERRARVFHLSAQNQTSL